jgi:hypothetical protein
MEGGGKVQEDLAKSTRIFTFHFQGGVTHKTLMTVMPVFKTTGTLLSTYKVCCGMCTWFPEIAYKNTSTE